jgi:hypothetical protein
MDGVRLNERFRVSLYLDNLPFAAPLSHNLTYDMQHACNPYTPCPGPKTRRKAGPLSYRYILVAV